MDYKGYFSSLIRSLQDSMTPKPTGPKMWGTPKNEVLKFNDQGMVPQAQAAAPVATPAPTARPVQAGDPDFRFAFETMKRDPVYAEKVGKRTGFQPVQPPADIGEIIRRNFPNEATAAALVAATENATYQPDRPDYVNAKDGSRDRGIMQINSNTFNGLMQRQAKKLAEMGITSFEDMYDPEKNAKVAALIRAQAKQANPQTQGWGRWFGWQDTGYDINNDYYSAPHRTDYELRKRGRK